MRTSDCFVPSALCTVRWYHAVILQLPFWRPRYLFHLHVSKMHLPRRQEAQQVSFTLNGSETSALVTHGEVAQWAAGSKEAIICSVSHAWETREHPDPCSFQLSQLVNCLALYNAAFFSDVWVFYDYTSLFQFKRLASEEASYLRAMANIQLMYAHSYTLTFRIQNLTPDSEWEAARSCGSHKLQVYHEPSGGMKLCQFQELKEHRPPYVDRGWCRAEMEWSSTRGLSWQNQRVGGQFEPADSTDGRGKIPMTPEAFERHMASAVFTHRDDAESITRLQAKIFFEKVTACEESVLQQIPSTELGALARALPHYRCLKVLRLLEFEAGAEEADAFAKASPARVLSPYSEAASA